jgi:hypothetical protein
MKQHGKIRHWCYWHLPVYNTLMQWLAIKIVFSLPHPEGNEEKYLNAFVIWWQKHISCPNIDYK